MEDFVSIVLICTGEKEKDLLQNKIRAEVPLSLFRTVYDPIQFNQKMAWGKADIIILGQAEGQSCKFSITEILEQCPQEVPVIMLDTESKKEDKNKGTYLKDEKVPGVLPFDNIDNIGKFVKNFINDTSSRQPIGRH